MLSTCTVPAATACVAVTVASPTGSVRLPCVAVTTPVTVFITEVGSTM